MHSLTLQRQCIAAGEWNKLWLDHVSQRRPKTTQLRIQRRLNVIVSHHKCSIQSRSGEVFDGPAFVVGFRAGQAASAPSPWPWPDEI